MFALICGIPLQEFARVRLTLRVSQVYETLLYLFTPFILPITIVINPIFWVYVFVGTMVLYLLNVAIFNEIHLRRKKERVAWSVLIVYYVRVQLSVFWLSMH